MTEQTEQPIGGEPQEPERKKPHLVVRLWRLWDRISGWWDRLVSWHDWLHWLLSLLKTKAGIAAVGTLGTAAAVGTVAIVQPDLLYQRQIEQPAPPPPSPPVVVAAPAPPPAPAPEPASEPTPPAEPVTVKAERWNANIVVFAVSGKDRTGRVADFEIAVLTREFTWLRGSAEQLARNEQALSPEDLSTLVFGPSTKAALIDSLAVIAVGLASAEGAQVNEAERAQRRAATSLGWIAATVASAEPPIQLWTLNLGQYRSACRADSGSNDTSWQRPYMMIAVRKHDLGVKLDEALKDAMTGKSNVPSPSCYSVFDLKRG
jgi:hypothetical protein